MTAAKKTNLETAKSPHEGLSYIKGGADSYKALLDSTNPKVKAVSKKEFYKMLVYIQEEERKRIGRELHDSVNPLLALANLYLELVQPNTAKEKFAKKQVFSVILTAIENIRSISSQLVISQKTECGLVQLITEMTEKISGTDIFEIKFIHSKEDLVSKMCPLIKLALYRILEEQLNNIIKHSRAKHVEIKLILKKVNICLSVSDDGVGFDTTKPVTGIGLKNIASRTKQFNGQMQIKSEPDKGCSLRIQIPFS